MIKGLVQRYINRTKNSDFEFDPQMKTSWLITLVFGKLVCCIRGWFFLGVFQRFRVIFLGRSVILEFKSNMRFGKNVSLGNYVRISALGRKALVIGASSNIGDFTRVIISSSFNNIGEFIFIGEHVGIGEFSYLGGGGGLNIGSGTIIGQYFSAHPENHNYNDLLIPVRSQGVSRKGIVIGDDCWIGSKVTVLDGVELGSNCIVAAGSVVTKSFSSNYIIAGVPARVVGSRALVKNK